MRRLLLLIILTLCSTTVFPQDSVSSALFPSKLQVESRDSNILIYWKDCKDITGERYRIYRSEQPFPVTKNDNVQLIGEVTEGKQLFRDHSLENKKYYYAVMTNYNGKEWWTIQYHRNVTDKPYGLSNVSVSKDAFKNITLQKENNYVRISYYLNEHVDEVGLFRSTRRFESSSDFNNVTLVRKASSQKGLNIFTDMPIPGIRYYYALAILKDLRKENFSIDDSYIISGSTVLEYNISTHSSDIQINRKTPLPSLLMESAAPEISDKMEKPNSLLLDIINRSTVDKVPEPYLFNNSQMRMPSNFKRLVDNKNWDQCINYLREIESTVAGSRKENYLNFYLSMFYTLSGKKEEAFFYLLKSENLQMKELDEWKQFIYYTTLKP